MIIKKCFNIVCQEVVNLDEMGKSLNRHKLTKLTGKVNRTSEEINLVIKKPPTKKSQAQMV